MFAGKICRVEFLANSPIPASTLVFLTKDYGDHRQRINPQAQKIHNRLEEEQNLIKTARLIGAKRILELLLEEVNI